MKTKALPYMERKVPKSEKYAHVTATLDTGLTVNKVRVVTAREYSRRRGEIYFRVSPSQLFELYCEYENGDDENIAAETSFTGPRVVTYAESATASDTQTRPYLILDVREELDYNQFHLLHAFNYPSAFVRRDYTHPEFYNYRNKTGVLIILCCDDERISCEVAKTLVDRGTENIYLLSGGLKEFYQQFPSYFEGYPPTSYTSSTPKKQAGSRLTTSDPSVPTSARLRAHNEQMGTSRAGTGSSRHTDSRSVSAMSAATSGSVAESIISRASARKGKF